MKIISKRKDYYDYLSGVYGIDRKVVYRREYEKIEEVKVFNDVTTYKLPTNTGKPERFVVEVAYGRVYFCGQQYAYIEVKLKNTFTHSIVTTEYYYTVTSFLAAWQDQINIKVGTIQYDFKTLQKGGKDYNKLYNSPQVVESNSGILKDIILKDYDFQKVVDPLQAYQRVAMFIAAPPDVPQTVPTDMHRFEAKGFSKKTSFRRM